MGYQPIITNKAQKNMIRDGISLGELMAAFNSSMVESGFAPGSTTGIYRTGKYEVGAMYLKDEKGQWKIISCWKRRHYY